MDPALDVLSSFLNRPAGIHLTTGPVKPEESSGRSRPGGISYVSSREKSGIGQRVNRAQLMPRQVFLSIVHSLAFCSLCIQLRTKDYSTPRREYDMRRNKSIIMSGSGTRQPSGRAFEGPRLAEHICIAARTQEASVGEPSLTE